jgi:C-terminal processing protease CtpA/Prc
VAKLLEKLKKENVKGVILDLRRNGGGSLEKRLGSQDYS